MELILNKNSSGLSQGYRSLIRTIERSGEFNILYNNLPVLPQKYWRKEEGFCLFKIDGVTMAFDANGGCYNVESMYNDGLFKTIFKDIKFIVKTQFKNNKFWVKFQKETGIKVIPWIMWCTLNFPLEYFKWDPSRNFKYVSTCAGGPNSNRRWGRPPYIEWCRKNGNYHTDRIVVEDFVKVLENCKWGLILQGGNKANCDGKNTREVEYSSCGVPLVLNYIPTYDHPFIPNKHFLYIEKPSDLKRLETEDPRPYAKASSDLWENLLKPSSAAKFLKRLVNV